jgi:hypothetical protein
MIERLTLVTFQCLLRAFNVAVDGPTEVWCFDRMRFKRATNENNRTRVGDLWLPWAKN